MFRKTIRHCAYSIIIMYNQTKARRVWFFPFTRYFFFLCTTKNANYLFVRKSYKVAQWKTNTRYIPQHTGYPTADAFFRTVVAQSNKSRTSRDIGLRGFICFISPNNNCKHYRIWLDYTTLSFPMLLKHRNNRANTQVQYYEQNKIIVTWQRIFGLHRYRLLPQVHYKTSDLKK